jgi:hypothetical protein
MIIHEKSSLKNLMNLSHNHNCWIKLVVDLRLRGTVGKRGLMYVPYYGQSKAFISNYKSWKEYDTKGKTHAIVASIISHESIHLTLNKFSVTASAKLDNLFGKSNCWEDYSHGLGDFGNTALRTSSAYNMQGKRARTKKR